MLISLEPRLSWYLAKKVSLDSAKSKFSPDGDGERKVKWIRGKLTDEKLKNFLYCLTIFGNNLQFLHVLEISLYKE